MTSDQMKARRKQLMHLQQMCSQENAHIRELIKRDFEQTCADIEKLQGLAQWLNSNKLSPTHGMVLFAVNCAIVYLLTVMAEVTGDKLDDVEDGGDP